MRSDRERLLDMLEACDRIASAVELGRERFNRDRIVQDAVVRRLEVLGEAASGISQERRQQHSEIPWRQIVALRNRVIHGYFGIDLEIVWNVATVELTTLAVHLRSIVDAADDDRSPEVP